MPEEMHINKSISWSNEAFKTASEGDCTLIEAKAHDVHGNSS